MSRIGKKPIQIPDKVKVSLNGSEIQVQGPLGDLKSFIPSGIKVELTDNKIVVSSINELTKSLHGLTRTLLMNMIDGVTKGFSKSLEVRGLGFKTQMTDSKLVLDVGYSNSVEYLPPSGIKIELAKHEKQNIVVIKGIDKQLVGEVTAEIRSIRLPEPYKGTGIRYLGEKVRHKVGKAVAGTGVAGAKA